MTGGALLLTSLFVACSSSTAKPAEIATPGVDAGLSDAPSTNEAEPDASAACAVTPVPDVVRAAFALAPFYAKYVALGSFPIVSSGKVPDQTLCVARDVVEHMLEHRPELADRLAEKKIRLALMAATELTTDIPEHSDLTPKEYWDERARGLGATIERPAVSAAEENVLCYAGDRYKGESILVHEVSHAIFNIAVERYEPAMRTKLDAAFEAAKAAGRFANTYAATNADEYWAEGAQNWFDTNISKTPSDGVHNEIHTRAQLKTYDSALAALLAEVFGDRDWRYRCP
jgi:hypothetical protein